MVDKFVQVFYIIFLRVYLGTDMMSFFVPDHFDIMISFMLVCFPNELNLYFFHNFSLLYMI